METTYNLTHTELIAVFKAWAIAATEGEECEPFEPTDEYAAGAAKEFARQLKLIQG